MRAPSSFSFSPAFSPAEVSAPSEPKSTPASHSASETKRRRDADSSNAREDSDATSPPAREPPLTKCVSFPFATLSSPASAAARAAGSAGSTSLSACARAPSARPVFAASKSLSLTTLFCPCAMSASTVAVTARDDSRRSSAPRGRFASGGRGGSSASGSEDAFGTLERPSANARAATSRATADANASARGAPRAPSAYDAARAASASTSPPSRSAVSAMFRNSAGKIANPRSAPSASARTRDRGFEAASFATRSEHARASRARVASNAFFSFSRKAPFRVFVCPRRKRAVSFSFAFASSSSSGRRRAAEENETRRASRSCHRTSRAGFASAGACANAKARNAPSRSRRFDASPELSSAGRSEAEAEASCRKTSVSRVSSRVAEARRSGFAPGSTVSSVSKKPSSAKATYSETKRHAEPNPERATASAARSAAGASPC